jgi:hypothetical protein
MQQQQQFGSCAAAEGLVLHKLQRVFREARAVYRLKDSSSRYSEWPHLQVRCSLVTLSIWWSTDLSARMWLAVLLVLLLGARLSMKQVRSVQVQRVTVCT